jgi:hypothetical protein
MKSFKSLMMFAVFGLLLSGCASTAHIEKDESVNFGNYKTFAWIDDSNDSNAKTSELQKANLQKAVSAELAKSGWREDKRRPDVILKHDILVEKTIKENSNPVYSRGFTRRYYNPYTRRFNYIYYPSQFMGYDNDQYETREGTLTITMIDAKTDKTIWQGWTTDEVDSKNLTSKEIQNSVKNIFRKFDVAKN